MFETVTFHVRSEVTDFAATEAGTCQTIELSPYPVRRETMVTGWTSEAESLRVTVAAEKSPPG